ncbi:MAG TPA: MFS transporter [Candidatus Omnitrophota bacterium]|nr:MFS transporter [Candidatus Omnitrophota bacterium]HPD85475.1 MFS transporter [Candidatus Omnitrophota bacterium]HRZ04024.1 MFS transporter [Candidatus Omnitrophota bacterium]
MSDLTPHKVNQSLRFSVLDGIFASGMVGLTQDYFTPFLLLLGATVRQVGILGALPNLVSALLQVKSADLTAHFESRKKIFSLFVFLQALMLLPMIFVSSLGSCKPMFFILMVTLFTSFGAFALPPWGSLMSDLVHEHKRGEYFGWRNKVLGILLVAFSFLAGVILHFMKPHDIFSGFSIIFTLAFLCRLASLHFLAKMHEPYLSHKKENSFTLLMFLRRVKESNFAKFVFFVAFFNFSVNLAAPFFAVFMLKDMHFSYLTYTVITATATLMVYLMMGRWGRHADRVGNVKVIRLTAPIIITLPLLWIISQNPVFLLFAQIVSGFAWAGFNLCASNFIYDSTTPEKRTRCIAYFNVINGLAICFGALIGGFLVDWLPPFLGYKILTLFWLTSLCRLLVVVFIAPKIKEVRPVRAVSNIELLSSMVGIHPILKTN